MGHPVEFLKIKVKKAKSHQPKDLSYLRLMKKEKEEAYFHMISQSWEELSGFERISVSVTVNNHFISKESCYLLRVQLTY